MSFDVELLVTFRCSQLDGVAALAMKHLPLVEPVALVCAPPDFAGLRARVGVPVVPVGRPLRPEVRGATPPSTADLPRRGTEFIAAQFDTDAATAEGWDAPVLRGVMPAGGWR